MINSNLTKKINYPATPLNDNQKYILTNLYQTKKHLNEFIFISFIGQNGHFNDGFWIQLKSLNEVIDNTFIYNYCDYYITQNTYKTPINRTKENLFSYHNIVIDIDDHADPSNKNIREAENIITKFLSEIQLQPSIIHYTGRGLQYWIPIKRANASNKMINNIYDKVLTDLCSLIDQELQKNECNMVVDNTASKKSNGLFRLFDTFNSKVGSNSEVDTYFDSTKKLSIIDINTKLSNLQAKQAKQKKQAKTNSKTKTVRIAPTTPYMRLNQKRLQFITQEIKSQQRAKYDELRNNRLLLYYNAAKQIYSQQDAKAKVKEINEFFRVPLPQKEIDNIIKSVDQYEYLNFSNERFFEFGQFSQEKWETKQSKAEQKKKEKEKRDKEIIKLHKQGLNNHQIEKKTGIARTTIIRIIKNNEKVCE